MITNREQQVLALIREDPMMSQRAIASRLDITRSAVAAHIRNLTGKGAIVGRGYVLSDDEFVAVIGGANLDIHGMPTSTLRRRDSNPGTVHTSPGGVGRNVAENLARLGKSCRLFTAIGSDEHGRRLMQAGRHAGIDMQYVYRSDSAPTSTYLSVLDPSGDMDLAVADMSVIDELVADRLQPHKNVLARASLIVIDTNLCDDALCWISDTFAGSPIFADTVSTTKALRLDPYLASIHTLKTSASEVEALTGMEARTQVQLKKIARYLHDEGVARVFISRGARGVYYSTDEGAGNYNLKSDKPDVRNAGGAGDAFLAGLAYAWLEHWPIEESLQVALAAAAVTVADPATSSPALSVSAVNETMEAHRERQ